MSLPEEFLQRLHNIIPANKLQAVIDSFSNTKHCTFRLNTLKETKENILTQLNALTFESLPHFHDCYYIDNKQRDVLTRSAAAENGLIYIQNPSSMLAPIILDPIENSEILDLCAAPGSKTSQIACMMKNSGRLAAVEKNRARFYKLKANCERLGITNTHFYLKDGATVWRSCENRFDKTLIDAPCSSETRFNSHDPKSYAHWNLKKIKEMTKKQWPLLSSAFRATKPGGTLVYSTCSFAPEENEVIVNKLIKRFKGSASIKPIHITLDNIQPGLTEWGNKKMDPSLENCIRILPNNIFSGFFICLIEKN